MQWLFPPASLVTLQVVATYGIVFFIFCVGMEQDLRAFSMPLKRIAVQLVIAAFCFVFALPFVFITNSDEYHLTSIGIYIAYVGFLCTVAALPILIRLIAEFHFMHTPLGTTRSPLYYS